MKDGLTYKGEFKNDMFHGKGKLIMNREDLEFKGIFNEGVRPDKGRLKYLSSCVDDPEMEINSVNL